MALMRQIPLSWENPIWSRWDMETFDPQRQLRSLDGEMRRVSSDMNKMYHHVQSLCPIDHHPANWRMRENFNLDNPFMQDTDGRKFRLEFDLRQFRPEEIVVRTEGNKLEVHAKHEEKDENKSVHREYHRQYVLPKELSCDRLVSKLSRDGVLCIEAPLPLTDGRGDRLIPIMHN
ncbi:hypothetical protein SNE40_000575 [Patella caerulea]|uniref:SHSP domain-containing protein n=1 Tax=Patella caerulea TaxID=87958 RepID=A0AAN8KAT9_PATCE